MLLQTFFFFNVMTDISSVGYSGQVVKIQNEFQKYIPLCYYKQTSYILEFRVQQTLKAKDTFGAKEFFGIFCSKSLESGNENCN